MMIGIFLIGSGLGLIIGGLLGWSKRMDLVRENLLLKKLLEEEGK